MPSDHLNISEVELADHLVATLTLPRPDRPEEAPLYGANTRSREVATGKLQEGFPALSIRRATQTTDASTLTVGAADPLLVRAIDGEDLLATAFQRLKFEPGVHLKLVRDREHRDLSDVFAATPHAIPGGYTRARSGGLATALDEGFTVVLDGIELRSPVSMQLAALFERAFGCVVNINGYLSARRHTSFGAHWDDQEVVILQLLGRKDWMVQTPADLSMNKAVHGDTVTGQVSWQGQLRPGDALYLPRGWGHLVSGIDELTFHYTITIPRLNGLQVLKGVLADLDPPDDGSACGSGVGFLPMSAEEAMTVPDLLDGDPLATDTMVRRGVARNRFRLPRRPVGSLRGQLVAMLDGDLSGTQVMCPCPGGWVVADVADGAAVPSNDVASALDAHPPHADGSVLAGIAGQLLRIPRGLLETAGRLTDGQLHDAGTSDPDVVRSLLRLGVLDVMTDTDLWGLTRA